MKKLLFAAGVLLASSTFAQTITIGRLWPGVSGYDSGAGASYSVVDLVHPARVPGNVTEAVVYWHMPPGVPSCASAFTVQFLRRSTPLMSYAVVATRGPFTATDGENIVSLVPPVPVVNSDVIAVTAAKPESQCGGVWVTYRPVGTGGMLTTSDLSNGIANAVFLPNQSPNVFAISNQGVVSSIIPAAGATAGAFGSFFRTTVLVTNNSPSPVSGKFVYHHYKTTGSPVDPSLPFTIPARQSATFPDIVTLIQDTGLGSIDIVTNNGETLNTIARVYNDQGSAGTNGFFEEAVSPDDALQLFQTGTFNLPDDPVNFRTNIGIRTLDSGATVSLGCYDAHGAVIGSTTRTLTANWFEQDLATVYFGIASTPPGGYVLAQVTGGAAIVYGSVTDNRTNDSAVHYFRP